MNRRARRCRATACGAALALAAAAGHACPLQPADGRPLVDGDRQLAWRVDRADGALPAARPFSLLVRLCPPAATLLRVDATMPAHGHGMNYRPTLVPLGEGRWRVDGLLLHMAGRWQLAFEVGGAGAAPAWLREALDLR